MRNRCVLAACVIVLLVGITSVTAAQAAPDPVDFRPFADGRNWIVKQPLKYRVGISHDSIVVPLGFVTDLLAMIENDVGKFDRDAIYKAVRAAGSFAWAANARDRARHLPRVLPADRLEIQARTLWPAYQAQLVRDSVAPGPENAIAAAFCARGSMSMKDALEKP